MYIWFAQTVKTSSRVCQSTGSMIRNSLLYFSLAIKNIGESCFTDKSCVSLSLCFTVLRADSYGSVACTCARLHSVYVYSQSCCRWAAPRSWPKQQSDLLDVVQEVWRSQE